MKKDQIAVILCLGTLSLAVFTLPARAEMVWKNVTNDLGGDYGWARGSCSTIVVAPGTDIVYTEIGKIGVYASKNGGENWYDTAKDTVNVPDGIVNSFVFDPRDPNRFWFSCMYGKGLFKSTDAGKHIQQIGSFQHLDGLTIDFTDPDRKTMVFAKHEQSRSLVRSKDGGESWHGIGMNLPDGTRFTTWPLLINSDILLTNTSGWGGGTITGIWRSENCGDDWTKVSDSGPICFPLLTSKGTVFYPTYGGVLRSTDTGKTWTMIRCPVSNTPIELPDGRIAATGSQQIYISTDNGDTWTPFGPKVPVPLSGIGPNLAYAAARKAFFVCHGSDTTIDNAIWRLDVP